MSDDPTLIITHSFDAPREHVFDAWLTREEWQAWLGPEGVSCTISVHEPRIGGRYRLDMHMPDGDIIPVAGEFKAIDRPNLLSFTWGPADDPAQQSLVTLTFTERNGATELTLRQIGLRDAPMRESFRDGWTSALNKLRLYLKGKRS